MELPQEKSERTNLDLFVQDTRSSKTIAEEFEQVEHGDYLALDELVNTLVDFEADFLQGT